MKKRLHNLLEHMKTAGLCPRTHGNTRRVPAHALSLPNVKRVVQYILGYADLHAILLPGRIPGYKRDDLKLLPSSTTKHAMWEQYKAATESLQESNVQVVSYSTFTQIGRRFTPEVRVMKPMTDLCWTCQQNSALIMKSVNCPEEEKTRVRIITSTHTLTYTLT